MLRPIDVPAVLIWGERDPVFVRETTERFGEWVPNLRVERIGRAGHFVQIVVVVLVPPVVAHRRAKEAGADEDFDHRSDDIDAPERENELLLEFLAR